MLAPETPRPTPFTGSSSNSNAMPSTVRTTKQARIRRTGTNGSSGWLRGKATPATLAEIASCGGRLHHGLSHPSIRVRCPHGNTEEGTQQKSRPVRVVSYARAFHFSASWAHLTVGRIGQIPAFLVR